MTNNTKKQTIRQALKVFEEQQELSGYGGLQQADPSVERLLEGFCYVTRQLEEFLNTSSPDFILHLLNVLWPAALSDIPAMSVATFDHANYSVFLAKDSLLTTTANNIKFSTMIDSAILPLSIESTSVDKKFIDLNILFKESCDLMSLEKILLYVDSEADEIYNLCYLLLKRINSMSLKVGNQEIALPSSCFPISLLKNIDDPFILINHFFQQPKLFLFFEICSLNQYLPKDCKSFCLRFEFQEILKSHLDVLTLFHLNCVPVGNYFSQACEPMLISREQDCYELSLDDGRDDARIIKITDVHAKTTAGDSVNLLNSYVDVQRHSGIPHVLHKLKNKFNIIVNVNEVQQPFILSTQVLVHQVEASQYFYWKNAKLTTTSTSLKGCLLDKLSLPIENIGRDASDLLAILQKKINVHTKKTELQCLLNTLFYQRSPKQLRMIAGIMEFSGQSIFQLRQGVVTKIVIWKIHLSRENFETLSALYHFALVLERLIDLYRPVNVCYQYVVKSSEDV